MGAGPGLVVGGREAPLPLARELGRRRPERRNRRERHRERTSDAGLGVAERHEEDGANDVTVLLLAPGKAVEPVLDPETEQLVPGRVELDLVDPLAEAIARAQDRWVLVREATELEWPLAAVRTERGATLLLRPAAFAPECLDEWAVLGEQVVALERRRLVHGMEEGPRRHQIVLNCSNGWRQALQ